MNHAALPTGYRLVKVMDFVRNRRQLLTVNIAALIVTALLFIAGLFIFPIGRAFRFMNECWPRWLLLAGMLLIYIPLHELTHGLLMHALSGVKPQYGFRLCYAYAGSTVWFDRNSHIAVALAPVVIWGALLQIMILRLPGEWFWPLWAVQISNASGSAGDVYCAIALLRIKGNLLIQDTGTRMRVMRRMENDKTSVRGNQV